MFVGTGVLVAVGGTGVSVAVGTAVLVGVGGTGVFVGVGTAVLVGVAVEVAVGVFVGTGVSFPLEKVTISGLTTSSSLTATPSVPP